MQLEGQIRPNPDPSHFFLTIKKTQTQTKHATDAGTKMHTQLQRIFISDNQSTGDTDLVAKISAHPEIAHLFAPTSQTEVPIAGTIDGKFISRRIDRLLIDDKNKTISILDYKTDINPDEFRNKYILQIREYATLLRQIYPHHKIHCYILWTHNFALEHVQ